jgi:hypothetical protein
VPVWLVILSDQLPVVGLVSRYLTNYLIGRRFRLERWSLRTTFAFSRSCGISEPFDPLFPTPGEITHVLLTRLPLESKIASQPPFDLHALGTPPAFILSQDQTLRLISLFLILLLLKVIPSPASSVSTLCERLINAGAFAHSLPLFSC